MEVSFLKTEKNERLTINIQRSALSFKFFSWIPDLRYGRHDGLSLPGMHFPPRKRKTYDELHHAGVGSGPG